MMMMMDDNYRTKRGKGLLSVKEVADWRRRPLSLPFGEKGLNALQNPEKEEYHPDDAKKSGMLSKGCPPPGGCDSF